MRHSRRRLKQARMLRGEAELDLLGRWPKGGAEASRSQVAQEPCAESAGIALLSCVTSGRIARPTT